MPMPTIYIDETKCNGCGQCITACAEGVLALVDGKAKVVAPEVCDGLGHCLPACPMGAISFQSAAQPATVSVPLSVETKSCCRSVGIGLPQNARLPNWPIQLGLIGENAAFLERKHWVIAADCSAFAGAFPIDPAERDETALLIFCPKLDNAAAHADKLQRLLTRHAPERITVLRMWVPCCQRLMGMVREALHVSERRVELRERIVSGDGGLRSE